MKRLSEKAVQDALEHHFISLGYSVRREVKTPVGLIDIILYKPSTSISKSEKVLIEVKEKAGMKSAVGQVQMYSLYEPCDRQVIIYFTYEGVHKPLDNTFHQLSNIEIYSVHQQLDINYLLSFQPTKHTERPCQTITSSVIPSADLLLVETSKSTNPILPLTGKMQEIITQTLSNQQISLQDDLTQKMQSLLDLEYLLSEIPMEYQSLGIPSENIMW